jgi:hypothetical protein
MKSTEQLAPALQKDKSIRSGSKAHLESLKLQLDEILEWEKRIKEAQGKEEQSLRQEFKAKFNITFNVKLLEKLTGVSRSLESKPEEAKNLAEMKLAQMNEIVAQDMAQEEQAAKLNGVNINEEFNKEAAAVDVNRDKVMQDTSNNVEQALKNEDNTDQSSVIDDIKSQNIDNENSEEKQKIELYSEQVITSFEKLSLSAADLETIPGLVDLSESAQLMIAKSLQAMAAESAKNEVMMQKNQKMQNKDFFGRLKQGIANSFNSKALNRTALLAQAEGGLEKHGANLIQMVNWAQTFIPDEKINEQGERQIDFLALQPGLESYLQLNEAEKQVLVDFNTSAMNLAAVPKHNILSDRAVAKNAKDSTIFEEYKSKQIAVRTLLDSHKLHAKEIDLYLYNADAKLNMMQFFAADPNLEREWSETLQKESIFKSIFKAAGKYVASKDNWKFLAGGFAGRQGLSMAAINTFGVAAGAAAIPLTAAMIGAWRGKERANKQLKEKDKFVDKKNLASHPLLTQRQAALKDLQSFLPLYSEIDNEQFKNKTGRMSFEDWSTIAHPDDLLLYESAQKRFKELDLQWQKIEQKNVERKTLKSEDLTRKLEDLLAQLNNTATREEHNKISAVLQRRLDFSKRLADDGLINFGVISDRSQNMIAFYNTLNQAQMSLLGFNVFSEDADLENSSSVALIETQARAMRLLNHLEDKADKKLDQKRKKFIVNQMIKGAFTGAIFSSIGSAAYGASSHIFQDGLEDVAMNNVVSESVVSGSEAELTEAQEIINDTISTELIEPVTTLDEDNVVPSIEKSSWYDVISNEGLKSGQHDSVWRSTKEIFLRNAESLGYEGNEDALNKWAEIQTNKALANSGELTDMVFEGNRVVLEKVNDSFVVTVEQGTGLEPKVALATERLDPLPKIESIPNSVLTEEVLQPSPSSEQVVNDIIIPNAKSLEASPVALNKWLAMVGDKFSLEAEEITYVGNNIVKTVIGGEDIFIDPVNEQYFFFNDAGEEISGFLADEKGNPVIDVQNFLVEKFNLESNSEFITDNGLNTESLDTNLENKQFIAKEAQDNITAEHINASAPTIDAKVQADINSYPWFKGLYENNAFKNLNWKLEDNFLIADKLTKGTVDKINLANIDLNNIAQINVIDDGYQVVLKENNEVLDFTLNSTGLEGENIFVLQEPIIEPEVDAQDAVSDVSASSEIIGNKNEQSKNYLTKITDFVKKFDNKVERIERGARFYQMDFKGDMRFMTSEKGFSVLSDNGGEKSFFDKDGDGFLDRMVINQKTYEANNLQNASDLKYISNKLYVFDDINSLAKEAELAASMKPESVFIADIDYEKQLVTIVDMSDGTTAVASPEQSLEMIEKLQSQYESKLANVTKELK